MGLNSELDQYESPDNKAMDMAKRISTLEQNMKNLEAEDNTVTEQLELLLQNNQEKTNSLEIELAALKTAVQDLQRELHPAGYIAGQAVEVAGYTFRAIPTAKQDAMKDGINVVGKPGVALEVSDGTNTAVIARLTYDHRLQRMVLSTGAGVN